MFWLKQYNKKGAGQIMNVKTLSLPKITFFVFCILFFTVTLSIVWPGSAPAATDVRDSMVKIYSVQNEPDYDNPWNMKGPEAFSGSGCVIEGNRILTNAHMVSDHTFIMVRLHGQPQKHPAKVVAVSHEADLALLSVDEPGFFKGVKPLRLGELPEIEQEVIVCGFPEGGDTLSTTKGVISRIELQGYAHTWTRLLAGQLDAAINSGNSGGPVLVGDRIVGVVMQTRKKSQNIGYMVPAPVIDHFLIDMEDGRYDGFPEDGIGIQPLENESLKRMFGLNEDQSGALVKQRQIGEDLVYEILRQGRMKTVRLKLDKNTRSGRLVPMKRYDVQPTYYVYGGLVFCPLTLNYLLSWGDDWSEDAPYNLLTYFVDGELTRKGEEVIVISKVLASNLNNGYDDLVDSRIVEVNGKSISNLQDLIRIVEADIENPFVVFRTEGNQTIALDRKKSEAAHGDILSTYRISDDRSSDLKTAVSNHKADGKEMAGSRVAETDTLMKSNLR
jgi:S1-C subfamily serine protease